MRRYLLDINTLVALLDPKHVFHDEAHRWVETTPDLRLLTCPLVQNGVVRIASQSAYPNAFGTTAEVHAVVAAFAPTRATSFALTTSPCSIPPIWPDLHF